MSGVLGMNYLGSLLFAINPVLHILEVRTLEYFGCIIAVESCNNSEKIIQDLFVLPTHIWHDPAPYNGSAPSAHLPPFLGGSNLLEFWFKKLRRSLFVASLWWTSTFAERKGRRHSAQLKWYKTILAFVVIRFYWIGNSRCVAVFVELFAFMMHSLIGCQKANCFESRCFSLVWWSGCVIFCHEACFFLQIDAILNFKHLAYTSGEGGRIHLYIMSIYGFGLCVCLILYRSAVDKPLDPSHRVGIERDSKTMILVLLSETSCPSRHPSMPSHAWPTWPCLQHVMRSLACRKCTTSAGLQWRFGISHHSAWFDPCHLTPMLGGPGTFVKCQILCAFLLGSCPIAFNLIPIKVSSVNVVL